MAEGLVFAMAYCEVLVSNPARVRVQGPVVQN